MKERKIIFWGSALVVGGLAVVAIALCPRADMRIGIGGGLLYFIGYTLGRWNGWKRGREGREP